MKVAITSTGNSLNSNVDSRFGRCSYFVIYDKETEAIEFIPNQSQKLTEGVGTSAVEFLLSRNISMVVSGEFGSKIKPMFDSRKVTMIVVKEPKTIDEIIKLINHKK